MIWRSRRDNTAWRGYGMASRYFPNSRRYKNNTCVVKPRALAGWRLRSAADDDRAAIVARVGDRHANGAGNIAGHALGPLDRDDAGRGQILIEADLVEVGAIEAIQIDVDRAAAVRRDTRERA